MKLTQAVTHPFVWCWAGIAICSLWSFRRKQKAIGWSLAFLVILIWILGATSLPFHFLASLETPYLSANVENAPQADAVVVLGGVTDLSSRDLFGIHFTADAGRPVAAFELMRLGKARNLILGGSYDVQDGKLRLEADALEHWFRSWNLPAEKIVNLGPCESTHDEIVNLKEVLRTNNWHKVLLVTSAYHMTRSQATVKRAGIDSIPVATAFSGHAALDNMPHAVRFIPGPGGLVATFVYLHEIAGLAYYRWKGWLD